MLCLCFVSLPVSYSLSDYYTFQLTKINWLIRLHDCAGFSVPSFFTCNWVRFSRGVTHCWYYIFKCLPFVFRETPNRVLLQTVKAKMKCSIISCISLGSKLPEKIKRLSEKKNTHCFLFLLKITTWHPRYVQWTIPSSLYQPRRKN